ncbi:MAG: superoxide dismutase [Puniceicoccales bacterium]|jgi:Fe-Mn family superoxide dismutase|nr:superoxide dismutase [Puniceicoccales bacterium]
MRYELPELPYTYDAFEPHIDAKTMELHHGKHHATYVNNLNALLDQMGYVGGESIGEFVANVQRLPWPQDRIGAAKFNGGGHHNHALFWTVIIPNGGDFPAGALLAATEKAFGSLQGFKDAFEKSAMAHFGSGWTWLCIDWAGELFVCSTLNHDSPNMVGYAERLGTPILTLDLWEHAYYLKYNNRRGEYVKNFWKILNWNTVAKYYESATGGFHV